MSVIPQDIHVQGVAEVEGMVHRCLLIQASEHCHGLYMPLLSWGFEEIVHSR